MSRVVTVQIGLAGRSGLCLFLSRLQSIALVSSEDGEHGACAGGPWHPREPLVTPAQSPGCACSSCAESALFQGLILNLCFSHPPQALSRLVFFFPFLPASAKRLLRSPGCQIILPLPAPPRKQLLQERLGASLQLAHSFLFHLKSNNSPLAEPSVPCLFPPFGGKQIPQDEVVLQAARRGCRHRGSLHRVA